MASQRALPQATQRVIVPVHMADGAQQPATKLGFSLSKAASRPKPQAPQAAATNGGGAPPTDVEFVSAIDDGQLASDEPRKERPLLVIPALPNTFETGTSNKRPRGVRLVCLQRRTCWETGHSCNFVCAVVPCPESVGLKFSLRCARRPLCIHPCIVARRCLVSSRRRQRTSRAANASRRR